jgi:biopolymer transport protein TolR
VEVKLPEARAQPVKAEEEKLVLSVKADRSLWLGGGDQAVSLSLEELEDRLRVNARLKRDRELYLMADRGLPYGYVVEVLAAVQRAGVTNLGMITNPAAARDKEKEP